MGGWGGGEGWVQLLEEIKPASQPVGPLSAAGWVGHQCGSPRQHRLGEDWAPRQAADGGGGVGCLLGMQLLS